MTAKKAEPAAPDLPQEGGSFVRRSDGTLKRQEWTEHPAVEGAAIPEAPSKPSSPPVKEA